jgi:hypothetical protein
MPLDRDIVREMWVYGDLKDRLGIKHRRVRKKGDIEVAPIFHQPHARSQSETSVLYENGRGSSTQLYLDSPQEPGQRMRNPPQHLDNTDSSQDPGSEQSAHSRSAYQHADTWAPRQQVSSDGTPPMTTVGPGTTLDYTRARSTSQSPRKATQNMPASSYEMQIRHQQEQTNSSFRTADEDWDDEPRSGTRTPDDRYTPGQAL